MTKVQIVRDLPVRHEAAGPHDQRLHRLQESVRISDREPQVGVPDDLPRGHRRFLTARLHCDRRGPLIRDGHLGLRRLGCAVASAGRSGDEGEGREGENEPAAHGRILQRR